MTDIRISVKNASPEGGTFLTPFWFGFHDNSFDLFETGAAASAGVEAMAEDGNAAGLDTELAAADGDAQSGLVTGAAGPIATGELTSTIVDLDAASNGYVSLMAMLLPSNDAFVGTGNAVKVADDSGAFLGPQTIRFDGDRVYDAGTEVNTELDAAFLNQTAPDTGVDEGGVIRLHPGFNGSNGNPVGEGDQNILGGTNAFGVPIDETAADFTLPGAQIAEVHINTVAFETGTRGNNIIVGAADDDIIRARAGNDVVFGRSGWDDLRGGLGVDKLVGGRGDDVLSGGRGTDFLRGGSGDDHLTGGKGLDFLRGGIGSDSFYFAGGDGRDIISGFDDDDILRLDVDDIGSLDDVLEVATEKFGNTVLDFGSDGKIVLIGVETADLSDDHFAFA